MNIEITNAIIESAELTIAEGVLTVWVDLSYGIMNQGFGGHTLYLPKSFKHHELLSPAGHFIFRVMEIAGVFKWSDLVGKTIRVKAEHTKVHAIGHIVKEDWFNPYQDFEEIRRKSVKQFLSADGVYRP